jgi:hypothetical protein
MNRMLDGWRKNVNRGSELNFDEFINRGDLTFKLTPGKIIVAKLKTQSGW